MARHRLPLRERMTRSLQVILPSAVMAALALAGGEAVVNLTSSPGAVNTSYLQPEVDHGKTLRVPQEHVRLPVIESLVNYTVKSGDSLWSISEAHCPSPADWKHLQTYNKTGTVLQPGQVITLACS